MITVLSGAMQNAGDFLITQRAKELIQMCHPEEKLLQFMGSDPLDDKIDTINRTRSMIILGGPGCRPNIYPGVYPLVKDIDEIQCPIYLLGSGWKGQFGTIHELNQHIYTKLSLKLLNRISETDAGISVRDHFTRMALQRNGLSNIRVTGCPAWFDNEFIGKPYTQPIDLNKICFTPPVSIRLFQQCLAVAAQIKKNIPGANTFACFHHGYEYIEKSGNEIFFENQRRLRDELCSLGWECVDLSEANKFDFYDDCDLHVGYRVHAHIYMLSRRSSSIMLYEDARGLGVDNALGLTGIPAFKHVPTPNKFVRLVKKIVKGNAFGVLPNGDLPEQICGIIERELKHEWASLRGYPNIIDQYFYQMRNFIKKI